MWHDQALCQPDTSKALRLPLLCTGMAAPPGAERSPLAEMPLSLRHSLSTPPSVTSAVAPLRPYPSPPEPQVCSARPHCPFGDGTLCPDRLVTSLHRSAPWTPALSEHNLCSASAHPSWRFASPRSPVITLKDRYVSAQPTACRGLNNRPRPPRRPRALPQRRRPCRCARRLRPARDPG